MQTTGALIWRARGDRNQEARDRRDLRLGSRVVVMNGGGIN